jgi:hypothetical protein
MKFREGLKRRAARSSLNATPANLKALHGKERFGGLRLAALNEVWYTLD